MDFKIEIKCGKCNCRFELRHQNFKQRDSMECPNCGQPFPQDHYQNLKIGVVSLGNIPELLPENADPFLDWQFKLAVKECDILSETQS